MSIHSSNLPYALKQALLKDLRTKLGETEYQRILYLCNQDEDQLLDIYLSQLGVRLEEQDEDVMSNKYVNQSTNELKKNKWKEKTKGIFGKILFNVILVVCVVGFVVGLYNSELWYGKVLLGIFFIPGLVAYGFDISNMSDSWIFIVLMIASAALILWGIIQGLVQM